MKKNELRDAYVPEEWEGLDYLNKYDRRVMGALLYSLAVTSQASDWTLITSMEKLREHCGIRMETLYESCRKFEMLGFLEWVRGKKRVAGEPSIGARFIFNPELIYNPPSEMPSMKELLMRKFNSGKVKVNAKVNASVKVKASSRININSKSSSSLSSSSKTSTKESTPVRIKENSSLDSKSSSILSSSSKTNSIASDKELEVKEFIKELEQRGNYICECDGQILYDKFLNSYQGNIEEFCIDQCLN